MNDSGEVFDPSCPDITGHILEGLSKSGYTLSNSKTVQKGVEYLKKSFDKKLNAWQARWGINYVYSAGCVLPALKSVGFDLKDDIVQKQVNWLKKKQNDDGGFGETTLSYNNPERYNGVGKSTVTQTAWGIMALLAVKDVYDVADNIDRGVQYLLD